jgi:hypothetical protein
LHGKQRFMGGLLHSAHTDGGDRVGVHRWPREGEDKMGKRFAMLTSVAAAGVLALGAQTVMALVKR